MNQDRERHRAYIAKRRTAWYKQGLCTECGSEIDGSYRLCKSCRIKAAAYQQRHRMKVAGMI